MITELEKEICEVLAKHYPFSAEDILEVYKKVEGFDVLISLVEFSATQGLAIGQLVTLFARKHEIQTK